MRPVLETARGSPRQNPRAEGTPQPSAHAPMRLHATPTSLKSNRLQQQQEAVIVIWEKYSNEMGARETEQLFSEPDSICHERNNGIPTSGG